MPAITEKEIEILNYIVEDKIVSQRKISNNLGISLGIVNLFLKKMAGKGLIKIKKTTNRKILNYILTPKGFKERLNYNLYFLKRNLKYYSQAKEVIIKILSELYDSGVREIYIFGTDDWAEIIYFSTLNFKFYMRGFISVCETAETEKLNSPVISFSDITNSGKKEIYALANVEAKKTIETLEKKSGNGAIKYIFF